MGTPLIFLPFCQADKFCDFVFVPWMPKLPEKDLFYKE